MHTMGIDKYCVIFLWYTHRNGIPVKTFPASLVVSSQLPGYTGGEVNTSTRVEIMFPIKVKSLNISLLSCIRTCSK